MIGKVKRVILIMLAISMALFAVPVFAGGDKPTEEEIKTVDEALKRANKFLNDFFSMGELFRTISTGNRGIIYELAINGGDSFGGMPILVYGDAASGAEAASLYGNDKRRVDINDQPRVKLMNDAKQAEVAERTKHA